MRQEAHSDRPRTGAYQSQSDHAKLVNPLYDWVADQFLSTPSIGLTRPSGRVGHTMDFATMRCRQGSRPAHRYR